MRKGKLLGTILIAFSLILSLWVFAGSSLGTKAEASQGIEVGPDGALVGAKYTGSVTDVIIPANCTSIPAGYFAGTGVTSITIEGSPSVGAGAFSNCAVLSTVNLGGASPITAETLDRSPIQSISSSAYTVYNKCLYQGTVLVYVAPGAGEVVNDPHLGVCTRLNLKDDTTQIVSSAFNNSTASVVGIPAGCTEIGMDSDRWTPDKVVSTSPAVNIYQIGNPNVIIVSSDSDPVTPPTPSTTYTITLVKRVYAADNTTYADEVIGTEVLNAGAEYNYTATVIAGYDVSPASYTGTATKDDTLIFTYKPNGGTVTPPAEGEFTVNVISRFYDAKGNLTSQETIKTDKYNAGDTYSYEAPAVPGYTVSPATLTGTVTKSIDLFFDYKATSESGGGSGGGGGHSGGGGGSTGGGGGAGGSDGGSAGSGAVAPGIAAGVVTVYDPSKYAIVKGANQSVPSTVGPVTMVCNGPREKFMGILIDGNSVQIPDFDVYNGSTIVTLHGDFIKKLSKGTHSVRFVYIDGVADTKLTITDGTTSTTTTVTYTVNANGKVTKGHTKDATPTTADGFDERYLLCIAIFLCGISVMMFSKQKKLSILSERSKRR